MVINDLNRKEPIEVLCRIKNSDNLFLLMQLKDILDRQWVKIECLNIKYLMGMRMDRLMDLNAAITLKIIADVINSLEAKKVEILEPHSDKTLELINNALIGYSIPPNIDGMVCYPDKGAYDRYNNEIVSLYCKKVRTENGEIKVSIVNPEIYTTKSNIIVIDDLCDGGGTFLAIAPKLRDLNPTKLILCITHAIQKIGIEKVASVYDEVYITNSYTNWDKEELPKNVKVINVL